MVLECAGLVRLDGCGGGCEELLDLVRGLGRVCGKGAWWWTAYAIGFSGLGGQEGDYVDGHLGGGGLVGWGVSG